MSRNSRAAHPGYERLKFLVAYDGRPFRGWQSQATGDAVQDHLERAFAKVVGTRVIVQGAGRTDAGVHALGQVAHADVPAGKLAPKQWMRALNDSLAPEARLLRVQKARPDFHARFDAEGKVYAYRIWNESFLHPMEIGRAWLVPGSLDLDALKKVALLLEGTHDFAGFAARRIGSEPETTRTIHAIRVTRRGALITLRFQGNGFLYKMVRLLTGSLIRCGQGRAGREWIQTLLAEKGKIKTHYSAPAEGLYLERVIY